MGRLLLSEMPEAMVKDLWQQTKERIRSEGAQGIRPSEVSNLWNANPTVSPLAEIEAEIETIRRDGFAISLGRISFGAGIIAVALPRRPLEQPIGLGIGGLSELIARDADQILDIIREGGRCAEHRFAPAGQDPRGAAKQVRSAELAGHVCSDGCGTRRY